jgi:phosphohistidine phosphatase SixA
VTTIRVMIVRHASAGKKAAWEGPDLLRPLDAVGERHARELADKLAAQPIRRLVSSPTLRCVQTLEPLAERTGLSIEITEALAADSDGRGLFAQLDVAKLEDSVLCTHGELMRPLLRPVRRRDITIVTNRVKRGSVLSKGVVWQLDITHDGAIAKLEAFPPNP